MSLLVALMAALCYAAAMVLQQHSAASVDRAALRPGFVAALLRRPLWLAGMAANLAGYGLRYVALAGGSLVVVQPVLATSLLLALPASARWDGRRMDDRDWAGALGIASGLVLFLLAARPSVGRPGASALAWLVTVGVIGSASALLVVLGRQHRGTLGARLLAGAGGLLIALVAALTKATADASGSYRLPSLSGWEPYALVLLAPVALLIVQSAFHAGPLAASLPVLLVVETVVGVVLGAAVFGERVAGGAGAHAAELAGLAGMAAGIVLVAGKEVGRAADRS
jgi:drug/metabolite transporter (DMT)-like permease